MDRRDDDGAASPGKSPTGVTMRPSSNFEAAGIGLTNPNASTAVDDESVAMCVSSLKVVLIDDSINLNVDESTMPSNPIIQSVDINTKSTSYARAAGASAKDQPKVDTNFYPLVADLVFGGVNISIPHKVVETVSTSFEHTLYGYFIGKRMAFLVVEYYVRNNWAKHGLKRIMMNSNGFFFFKFDLCVGLEAILEGGPWLIRKSLIILKKWLMDTRLFKEELTRILIWVKLHDVNSEADLVDVVTIDIPSLTEDGFIKETIRVEYEWRLPRCDICKIFGHVHDHCPKKVVSTPIVTTSNVVTLTVEKKEEEVEEHVENVYDESANLFHNSKIGERPSFTAAAG
ncbi:zinc knuckle CX2CX4HX4C containing protein [Tanacetum coccineum]